MKTKQTEEQISLLPLPAFAFSIYGMTMILGSIFSASSARKKLATLFGIAFFSAWLGGVLLTATGSYSAIWIASGILAAVAARLSFSVKEPAA